MNESNFIECNSIETIDKTKLTEQTIFRLSEIIRIENYFHQNINQRKSCSKKLNKYVTTFQALIDLDIGHEEFIRILKEKDKYKKMKGNLRSENEEYKIMRLSSVKSNI